MQIKNLNQLFFILIIGLFALQTSTLFCVWQKGLDGRWYDDSGNGPTLSDKEYQKMLKDSSLAADQYDDLGLDLPPQQYTPNPSFLQSSPSPTRQQRPQSQASSSSSFPDFSGSSAPLTEGNLSFLSSQPQQQGHQSPSMHSIPSDFPIPSSPAASIISTGAPENLTFDGQDHYPTIQPLNHQGSQIFPSSSSSSSSAPFSVEEGFSTFSAAPATGLTEDEHTEIIKFLDSSLVLVAQLGSGKLNPEEGKDQVAVRTSLSTFDRNIFALPFQLYEAGAANTLGLSFGDEKDKNPEKAGIFGRPKSTVLEDSVMHKTFRDRCQELSKKFHRLCTQKFEQLKMARDADKNGSTADDGIAFWSASHKFLTLPSYLVYWAEILEITQEINRLCQREGTTDPRSSSSSSSQGTMIQIDRGTPDDAKTNTPTTTVSELATQIAEILFGRGSELNSDLTKLAKNTAGDGLDTILLVNEAYLNETRVGQLIAEMRWSVHHDFQFKDEQPEQVQNGSAQFLRTDALMRRYFAEIATQLQALLIYLTGNAQVETNVLTEHENEITSLLNEMIPMFFSDQGFGHDLAEPILELAQVSESWRFVISTLIENNSHQKDKSKKALEEYVDFVGKKEKYGIKGPDYKISDELEKFCEERAEFFKDTRHSSSSSSSSSNPLAYVEQITTQNGLPAETARTTLFALRDQDFRLPVDATHRGALCLNCGHSPFSLALVIGYLSNPINRLYKVFFEDNQAFNGNDPKRESLDQISARLWGDAERLSGGLHKRDTLDFVHNPMSFRCSWCRHLERVWSKSENLETRNGQSWQRHDQARLSSLFNQVYIQGLNQQEFRLQIADFPIALNPDCLIFPAHNDSEQKSFQTIGVDLSKIIPLFRRGPGEENVVDLKIAFPGISDQEILKFKLRIARTLQDLFGAWMAMTPEEGQQFAMLTPSERWTGAGASIAFPPTKTFQGGSRPGTLTLPPGEPERFEGTELSGTPDETGGFTSPSPSSLTKTSPKRPPRKASTLPNRPSSSSLTRPTLLPSSSFTGPIRPGSGSHTATSIISSPSDTHTFNPSLVPPPALDEPGRLDLDEPIKDPDEFNAGPDETPGTPTSTSKKRNKKALPSDGRSALTPSPHQLPLTSLDEEEDNPDPDQPPKTEKDKTPTRSRRRRVKPEDDPIEEMKGSFTSAIRTQKGRFETPRYTLHLSSKLTTTPEFEEAIQRATSLLEGINLYTSQLMSKQNDNPNLQPILQDLEFLSRALEQAIRTAEQTAGEGNPVQATNDLTTDTNQAQAKFDEIAARASIIQEEGRAAADFASMQDRMRALAPVLSSAQNLARTIQEESGKLKIEGSALNNDNKKNQALEKFKAAVEALKIIDPELTEPIETASSWITNPTQPLPANFVTNFKKVIDNAQKRYAQLLTELRSNLERAQQLDQAEAKREEKKARRRTFVQNETGRDQGNVRAGAFTGPERQTPLVRVASSHKLSPDEDPVSSDFPGSSFSPHTSISPHDLNAQLINVGGANPTTLLQPKMSEDVDDEASLAAGISLRSRPRTPTPPRSPKPVTSPRRTPPSASLSLTKTDQFEESDEDVPDLENFFPPIHDQQSLVEDDAEGRLQPDQDQNFNPSDSFSTDREEDTSNPLAVTGLPEYDEDPEMAQILENVAPASFPPDSPRFQPPRNAFTTSASPSDRLDLFAAAKFGGLDQPKASRQANPNDHELDQSGPAFPRGFDKREVQGFGRLEDDDPLGDSASRFRPSPYFQQYGSSYSQQEAKSKQPFKKERSLQAIANDYWDLLNPKTGITYPGTYYAQIGPKIKILYKEASDHSGQGTYKFVQGGAIQNKNDLLHAIEQWVKQTTNPAILGFDKKIILGEE